MPVEFTCNKHYTMFPYIFFKAQPLKSIYKSVSVFIVGLAQIIPLWL